LSPLIPRAAAAIFEKLNTPPVPIWRLKNGQNLTPGTPVQVGDILFAKHDAEGEVGGGGEKKSSDTKETKEKARPVPVAKKYLAVLPTDVSRLQMKVGTITKVWQHPDAEKLFVELIDVGDAGGPRQVVSGLVGHVSLDAMLGKKLLVVANMKPTKMRGVESTAMVLCGSGVDGVVEPVAPPAGAANGTVVTCADFPGEPDEVLNPKKKVFEAVALDFCVKNGVATYKGCPFSVGGEVCTLPTLKDGTIK
jgi:methionine--tRNA ligase beta chain